MSFFLNQRYWVTMSFGVSLCSVLLLACENDDNPHKGNSHMEYWTSAPVECQFTKQSYFMTPDFHTVAWLKYKCVDREEIWVVLITGRDMPPHGLKNGRILLETGAGDVSLCENAITYYDNTSDTCFEIGQDHDNRGFDNVESLRQYVRRLIEEKAHIAK